MTQSDVRNKLASPYFPFKKTPSSKVDTDDFNKLNIHVFYHDDLHLRGVEVFSPSEVTFDEISMLNQPLDKVVSKLRSKGYQVDIDSYGVDCLELGISVSAPGHMEDSSKLTESIYCQLGQNQGAKIKDTQ
ncbi:MULTISPECIES: hypothetical protein [unclassified Endozoicomonas]|uniref:hypothetical protein n=1 Tax=unclassified Endozoicomonas TaxID=2644528 RepID=UPI003BB6C159